MTRHPALLAALDVAYVDDRAFGACVSFHAWSDSAPAGITTVAMAAPGAYEPGAFYKRELDVLLALLNGLHPEPDCVLVDGYVHFGDGAKPALGARLRHALNDRPAVVGVAKSQFTGDDWSARVTRGASARPLYVTAAGVEQADVARRVAEMHGSGRIPTLLALADRTARELALNER